MLVKHVMGIKCHKLQYHMPILRPPPCVGGTFNIHHVFIKVFFFFSDVQITAIFTPTIPTPSL